MANALDKHRKAYERFGKANEEVIAALAELENARVEAVVYLADRLAEAEGVVARHPQTSELAARGPRSPGGPSDPLHAFVEAAESNYARSLGSTRVQTPLAIQIVNNQTLLGLPCPHCGKAITADELLPVPPGAVGRVA